MALQRGANIKEYCTVKVGVTKKCTRLSKIFIKILNPEIPSSEKWSNFHLWNLRGIVTHFRGKSGILKKNFSVHSLSPLIRVQNP